MGIIRGLFEKRSSNAEQIKMALYGVGGNTKSYTGLNVTPDSAMSATAIFNGVRIISEAVSSLPLNLYKRLNRGKDKYTASPLYQLMHLKPNPEMTSMNFREALVVQNILYGDCYSEIQRDGTNRVVALWPLLSKSMTVKRVSGELVYVYQLPGAGKEKILARDLVLHVPGFSPNGLTGYNVITRCKESIGLSLALEQYGAAFFGNGANPDGVLMHPLEISEAAKDNLRKAFEDRHKGLTNSHRIAILEEGMKYERIGVTPEESQAIEARRFQIDEVARILNLPVHMLKDLQRSTNNNIEQQSLEFVIYCIRPWLVRFEQNYNIQLLSDKEQNKYFFEHLIDGLLRGDIEARFESYSKGIQNGIWSPNEVREMENRNPYEGGDVYVMQMNLMPVDLVGEAVEKSSEPEEPPEGERAIEYHEHTIDEMRDLSVIKGLNAISGRYHRLLLSAYQTIVSRETLAVKKAAKKHFEERGVSGFNTWMNEFYTQHEEFVRDKLYPVLKTYQEFVAREAGTFIGVDIDETGFGQLEQFFDDTVEASVKRYIRSSNGQLVDIVSNTPLDDIYSSIIKRMDEWYSKRAKKIAQDESVRHMNATARETWAKNGITRFKWRTQGESCPFCNHLNGRVVGVEQSFLDAGDVIYASNTWADIYNSDTGYKEKNSPAIIPTDTKVQALKTYSKKMHPPVHRGCDCFILPERGTK